MKTIKLSPPPQIGSYSRDDVIFVLKDISHLIKEQCNEDREHAIQSGTHYSEMLPIEYQPSEEYLKVFHNTLRMTSEKIAMATAIVSEKILKKRGKNIVLLSLARAGTPAGILIKRYIKLKYGITLPHYSISIIRDKGIDENALFWIRKKHPSEEIQFIDGWTGKGVINNTLKKACMLFFEKYNIQLNPDMAVIADPGQCVETSGTREDFLIPSACLNSTVSGLISRTFHREDIIGPEDYHGVKCYSEWKDIDLSNLFLDTISIHFPHISIDAASLKPIDKILNTGIEDVKNIQKDFNIPDINLIKPGVGEATRVLLRRIPWKILIDSYDNPDLKHIIILAKEKNVEVCLYKNMHYSCCGLIKSGFKKGMGDI